MDNKNQALKSGFWFAICNIVQKSVMFITVPIFTRMMTSSEYGLTAIYQSWNSILSIIVTLSLSLGVFNNGMLHYKDDRDQYISSMQGLSTVSAVCFLLVAFGFRRSFAAMMGLPEQVVVLMFISFVFQPSFEYWSARSRYEYRYKGLLTATIIYSIFSIIIPVVAVWNGSGNLGTVKVQASLITLITFSLVFYIYIFLKGKHFYVKEYWKYAFWFNLPLLPNYLSNIILGQSDRIMIGSYCGEEAAGIYSVACYLQTGVAVIIGAINSAFIPWLYEQLESRNYRAIQNRVEQLLVMLGFLTFGIVACAPELIRIMAPEKYYEAVCAVPPVVIGTYLTVMYTLCANVEIYYEKRVFMSCATMIAAGMNVLLNYLLIPVFGYIACAYTTMFCYLIYGMAHYGFMCRIRTADGNVRDLHIYDMHRNIVIYVVAIALSAGQMLLYQTIIWRYALLISVLGIAVIKGGKKYHVK